MNTLCFDSLGTEPYALCPLDSSGTKGAGSGSGSGSGTYVVRRVVPRGATPDSQQLDWPAPWEGAKIRGIRALKNLPPNWDSYGAYPIDQGSIGWAVANIQQIARMTTLEPKVCPTPSGFVQISWKWDQSLSLDLEFLPNGEIEYGFVDFLRPTREQKGLAKGLGDLVARGLIPKS